MNNNLDWAAIREDYESGESLRALASKYGVSKSVIGKRKYQEQWTEPKRTKARTEQNTQQVIHPDVNAAVRATVGFKLRYQEFCTWEEVAKRAGYASRGAAKNAVDREALRHVSSDIEEIRREEFYRLTQLQARCYKAAMDEENEGWSWAVDRFAVLSKRKSELMGLDAKPDALPDGVTIIRSFGVEVTQV